MGPFISASQDPNDKTEYNSTVFPRAFGHNTLLLSSNSAAILDTPTNSTIANIRAARLGNNETWDIAADVQAYVATRDTESDFRTNDETWMETIRSNHGPHHEGDLAMTSMWLYHDQKALGIMPSDENNACYISMYDNSSVDRFPMQIYDGTKDPIELDNFRTQAHKFRLTRTECHGHWRLSSTATILIEGHCDIGSMADSKVLQGTSMAPFAYDILPSIGHSYKGFAENDPKLMPWLNATHAVSVVTSYWSRAVYMIYNQGFSASGWSSGPYQSSNQTCTSTRPALSDQTELYVVLAVQPAITLIALLVAAWLWRVPIGRGFGLVSIMSGYDPSKSSPISGAGELDRHAFLQVVVTAPDADTDHTSRAEVQFRVVASPDSQPGARQQLRGGRQYG